MKIGIMGLPGAGRTTLFEALTREGSSASGKRGNAIVTLEVPDERVGVLSGMYKPKKTTYAKVEYLAPAAAGGKDRESQAAQWNEVRNCDALIEVVGNFDAGAGPADPEGAVKELEEEMIFADFAVLEKRRDRLAHDRSRGKKSDDDEMAYLDACISLLESGRPLREDRELATHVLSRAFGMLSAKPLLLLFNNDDEDGGLPGGAYPVGPDNRAMFRGRLESELASMSDGEAAEFMEEFGISDSALDRVVRRSYELLGLVSFFTVGDDEVKAWTIADGTEALDAAEEIHSDIKKGFIRAEVVSYSDLIEAGDQQEAKKRGKYRLEGKTYRVADGDIINFRFNV